MGFLCHKCKWAGKWSVLSVSPGYDGIMKNRADTTMSNLKFKPPQFKHSELSYVEKLTLLLILNGLSIRFWKPSFHPFKIQISCIIGNILYTHRAIYWPSHKNKKAVKIQQKRIQIWFEFWPLMRSAEREFSIKQLEVEIRTRNMIQSCGKKRFYWVLMKRTSDEHTKWLRLKEQQRANKKTRTKNSKCKTKAFEWNSWKCLENQQQWKSDAMYKFSNVKSKRKKITPNEISTKNTKISFWCISAYYKMAEHWALRKIKNALF